MENDKSKEVKKSSSTPQKPNSEPPKKDDNRKVILNLVTVVFLFMVVSLVLIVAQRLDTSKREDPKQFSDLISLIRDDKVSKIEVSPDQKTLFVEVYKDQNNKKRSEVDRKEFPNISIEKSATVVQNINTALGGKEENRIKIGTGEGQVEYIEQPKPWYVQLIENGNVWYILLTFIILGSAVFFIRRVSDSNNRAISFGNSRARVFDEADDKEKITFKDVAGNEEAKQELMEVVDFLKRPEEYVKMGAKIPRGALLVGSPGTGKTLLAKAIAGEAEVPFFYVSGSEFVEMFVGVGAGRVRDLFKKAKKKAPCVVFIDEIDAVGRQRGAGLGGGNDEREQTLNQILVEMDGFEPTSSIIVVGATNRPDVLDPALLRPGRFDRQVTVTTPDRKEREKILEVHAKNKKMAKNVDLGIIAKRTPGFSGADLANVLNEAAILAVREKKSEIDNTILRESIEKVAFGPSLKSKIITEKQKMLTAYHESGHALLATVLPNAQKVQKVTIIPRGRAAGYSMHIDDDNDAMTRTRSEFLDEIKVMFGGYCTEEIVFGDVSTGASNDLAKATETARNMVRKYGMSKLGPISFDEDRGMTFLGKDMAEKQNYSEEVAKQIDLEIERIIKECYEDAKKTLSKFRKYLDSIANSLIEKEVLEFEEFSELVKDIVVARGEKARKV
jgi:cell division protease FtsH